MVEVVAVLVKRAAANLALPCLRGLYFLHWRVLTLSYKTFPNINASVRAYNFADDNFAVLVKLLFRDGNVRAWRPHGHRSRRDWPKLKPINDQSRLDPYRGSRRTRVRDIP